MTTTKTNSPFFRADIFNTLRAVAMLCVFTMHAHLVIVSYAPPGLHTPFFLHTPAWAAMWMLFGLSGFLIGAHFYKGKYNTPKQIRSFLVQRFLRVGIPYVTFLLLGVLCIHFTSAISLKSTWIRILTFTYNGQPAVSGLGAMWFVSTIMQLYLVAPLMYHGIIKKLSAKSTQVFMFILLLAGLLLREVLKYTHADWYIWVYTFSPLQWDLFFVPFMAYTLPNPLTDCAKNKLKPLLLLAGCCILVVCGKFLLLYRYEWPTVFTILMALLCWLYKDTLKNEKAPVRLSAHTIRCQPFCLLEGFALISYSFYLWHSVILTLLPSIIRQYHLTFSYWVYLAITVGGGFVLCTLVAWGMWFFVERPTDIWRKQLRAS